MRISNSQNINIPTYVSQNNSREKNNIDFSKDDAVSLEISYEGQHAIQLQAKEEKSFVYDMIRQNFLVSDTAGISEDERQASISLGIKKAQYAAENFIPESQREQFLQAMNNIADLASSGKADAQGQMDYGINKPSYLGHGSGLVSVTNAADMMKKTDAKAYKEYEKIQTEGANEDAAFNKLKYLTNWYAKTVSTDSNAVQEYEKITDVYAKESIGKRKTDHTFQSFDISSKSNFLASLIQFQKENPNNFCALLKRELSNPFYYS